MSEHIDRRRALALFGAMGLSAVAAACGGDDKTGSAGGTTTTNSGPGAAPAGTATSDALDAAGSCALTPQQAEGPFYLDIDRVRSDIREDRQGTPLRLAIRVREHGSCQPIADAAVDIWHCDASGLYSGFESASGGSGPGQPGGGAGATDTTRYLRGTQITNSAGIVEFLTIYPGWYQGRTVHIHCKVHLNNAEVLTSQLYFDEKVTSAVYAAEPYASHGDRSTFNADDGIFSDETVLTLSESGEGYLGVINLDVKSS